MNINEWVDYHNIKAEKRCGKADSTLHPSINGETTLWGDEVNGALQFVVQEDILFITGMVGNFKFWQDKYISYCKAHGINRIVGYTCSNNPKAVARLMGAKITRTWHELVREV